MEEIAYKMREAVAPQCWAQCETLLMRVCPTSVPDIVKGVPPVSAEGQHTHAAVPRRLPSRHSYSPHGLSSDKTHLSL